VKYNTVLHVIGRKRLKEAAEEHSELAEPLDDWFRLVKRAAWESIVDVRRIFPHADAAGDCTVFNIKGNSFRLIARIRYQLKRVYILSVLTHAEYDKGDWTNDCL
jgi:mRNA interferase HigB